MSKASAVIGPKFYGWDNETGKPLAFGLLYTYETGTNIPKATYTSEDKTVANPNPVVLNGAGYADVYLDGSYKFILKDADEVEQWSADPVTAPIATEWVNCTAATYLSPTQFSVPGDQTATFPEGQRIRLDANETEYEYGNVVSASFGGGVTTITVSQADVKTGLVTVCVSILSPDSSTEATDRRYSVLFPSVAAMLALTPIGGGGYEPTSGDLIKTTSYFSSIPYAEPQGGGAEYRVMTNTEYGLTPDEVGAAFTLPGDFVAVFNPVSKKLVNTSQFGIKSDVDASTEMQAIVDYMTGVEKGIIRVDRDIVKFDELDMSVGSVTFEGVSKRGNSPKFRSNSATYLIRHSRGTGLSGDIHFRDLRIEGNDIGTEGVRLDNANYFSFENVEISGFTRSGLIHNDAEDGVYRNLDIRNNGGQYAVDVTGTYAATNDSLVLSGSTTDFEAGDVIRIAGAGEGGKDLITYVRTKSGTSVTTAWSAGTIVAGASISRIDYGLVIGATDLNGSTEICNSIKGQVTIERNRGGNVYGYRCEEVVFTSSKFHGVTLNEDPSAAPVANVCFDRADRCKLQNPQFAHSRYRHAIFSNSSNPSGGTQENKLIGGTLENLYNTTDATDVIGVELIGGSLTLDNNTFADQQGHSSYLTNGIDIKETSSNQGIKGDNWHLAEPGGGKVVMTSQTVNRPDVYSLERATKTIREFTPRLEGATSAVGDTTYTEQLGTAVKIGTMCFASFIIEVDVLGTDTGGVEIKGLPYTGMNEFALIHHPVAWAEIERVDLGATYTGIIGKMLNGGSKIIIRKFGDNIASQDLDFGEIQSGTRLEGTLIYMVNQE